MLLSLILEQLMHCLLNWNVRFLIPIYLELSPPQCNVQRFYSITTNQWELSGDLKLTDPARKLHQVIGKIYVHLYQSKFKSPSLNFHLPRAIESLNNALQQLVAWRTPNREVVDSNSPICTPRTIVNILLMRMLKLPLGNITVPLLG